MVWLKTQQPEFLKKLESKTYQIKIHNNNCMTWFWTNGCLAKLHRVGILLDQLVYRPSRRLPDANRGTFPIVMTDADYYIILSTMVRIWHTTVRSVNQLVRCWPNSIRDEMLVDIRRYVQIYLNWRYHSDSHSTVGRT